MPVGKVSGAAKVAVAKPTTQTRKPAASTAKPAPKPRPAKKAGGRINIKA